jgi:hypothetical protein
LPSGLFDNFVFIALHEFEAIAFRVVKETDAHTGHDGAAINDVFGPQAVGMKGGEDFIQIGDGEGKMPEADGRRFGDKGSILGRRLK